MLYMFEHSLNMVLDLQNLQEKNLTKIEEKNYVVSELFWASSFLFVCLERFLSFFKLKHVKKNARSLKFTKSKLRHSIKTLRPLSFCSFGQA